MPVTLHGYEYSVYSWIARLVLAEKGVDYDYVEVNPFSADMPAAYLTTHPFRRVPALVHDGFTLYETSAIARYIDEMFPGPALQPTAARERARMSQIIAIVDAYGYWPMVRQVYSHRVFRPHTGQPFDEGEIHSGLSASARVLAALDSLAAPTGFLVTGQLSLADLHLAPMMGYFTTVEEGRDVLARYGNLSRWWGSKRERSTFAATKPVPPGP
jgi:glutathione S-transferase